MFLFYLVIGALQMFFDDDDDDTLIGIKSCSLFDLCMNILNRIVGY